jgi:hypothetical protein
MVDADLQKANKEARMNGYDSRNVKSLREPDQPNDDNCQRR